jgi:CRP-like cAMP-binding protein
MKQTGQPKKEIVRRKGSTDHLKPLFFQEFPKHATILATCDAIGISRTTFHRWREADPEFAKKFIEADSRLTERLERTAYNIATNARHKAQATLLIFLLKSRDPEKYKDRIQQDIDPKVIDLLVGQFLEAIRRHVPEFCPNCNTHLGLEKTLAQELETLSAKLAGV